ncbi:SCP domain-containing protein (plasmid) [Cupriavidus necator H16]|nr:CAP domain-containing protein [Cupriavidus necator]QCC05561.1 CAP domain-containing protein [Cupriavidus necator H16]QQB81383.1 CAP domain-containing protein [Cupriavidus necator]
MQNSKLTLSVLATAMTLALAACGGGGGDDGGSKNPTTPPTTPTTPTTPQVPTSVPPATSVGTPTYPAGDFRLASYTDLNNYRLAMGVGALRQDAFLDAAADNHLAYMKANALLAHEETVGKPGFTGVNPYEQAVAAGASKNQWVSQSASMSAFCVDSFKNSVYHLQGITSNQETIGVANRDGYCVINFGLSTGANGSGYGLPSWGGQQLPAGGMAYSPVDGERVVGSFTPAGESPNPAPDLTAAGHPIMFRVPAPESTDVLTVSNFSLAGPGGAVVPVRVLVPSKAKSGSVSNAVEDARLFAGVVFMLPTQPLSAGTYTATFSGARNGIAINKSWSFTAF